MTPLRFSKNAESILLGGIGIEYCLVGSELILSELYRGNIDSTHIFSYYQANIIQQDIQPNVSIEIHDYSQCMRNQ